jgi:hypothetical protein
MIPHPSCKLGAQGIKSMDASVGASRLSAHWLSVPVCHLLQVLQHLDEEGCSRVAAALRNLPQSTVLVVGQAAGFASRAIDASDVVVKSGGVASIALGE